MNPWPQDLEIYVTADTSPTLALTRADGYVEKMHHSGGALSESIYIYHSALVRAIEQGWQAKVISFGLGCGYNELLTLAELLRRGTADFKIWSFEAHPFLRDQFARWLHDQPANSKYAELMNTVAGQIGRHFEIDARRLKSTAEAALASGHFEIKGAYPDDAHSVRQATVVFYDAFSNKMEASSWSEDSFERDLGPLLADACVFTTYAKTGALKRSLRKLGFRLIDRAGFLGKRESTLAIREQVR